MKFQPFVYGNAENLLDIILKPQAEMTTRYYILLFLPRKDTWLVNFSKYFVFHFFFQLGFMVFVCVCVYTLPPWRLLPTARCLRHIWGVRINDVMLWVSFQVLLPSSFISISKNVIFHLERRNSRSPATGEKTIWYMVLRTDDIYWYRI